MENKLLTYSNSPHIKRPRSTKNIMINVCIALLPACISGVLYFGLKAFIMILLSCLTAFLSEIIFQKLSGMSIKKALKNFDFSSIVTGILVSLTIGVNYPVYAPVLGSIFAIVIVKMIFGGTGKNLVNPAIVGRIFIFMSFQSVVGAWLAPNGILKSTTPITGATTLENLIRTSGCELSNINLFLGNNLAGCIGETCKPAILLGAIYLASLGIINLIYPIIYISVTGLFSVVLGGFDFTLFIPSILSGGLFLGAFFMATDYTTTPNTVLGNIIYFIILGLITAGLRFATKMETVSFAILIMNLTLPFFDKFIINKPFGYQKQIKEKKQQ